MVQFLWFPLAVIFLNRLPVRVGVESSTPPPPPPRSHFACGKAPIYVMGSPQSRQWSAKAFLHAKAASLGTMARSMGHFTMGRARSLDTSLLQHAGLASKSLGALVHHSRDSEAWLGNICAAACFRLVWWMGMVFVSLFAVITTQHTLHMIVEAFWFSRWVANKNKTAMRHTRTTNAHMRTLHMALYEIVKWIPLVIF